MNVTDKEEHDLFENEVRRIARQLWPAAQYSGAAMVDGKERDGIFETEDCVHLVEATVSRGKSKAVEDVKKLTSLARQYQKVSPSKAVKCWFVTKQEPTADQRGVANAHKHLVNAISFPQFQSKLIDAAAYLGARDQYPFGSVRDPATGHLTPQIEYVHLDLLERSADKVWSIGETKNALMTGERMVILGDYGAGKSMTLREIYRELKKAFLGGKTVQFPVMLNLRDHIGQPNAAEVLERHGRNIGFPNPSHLVRAWRAGYVTLLLDGFDEVSTLGIQGLWRQLKDARYRAMQVIREFVRSHPSSAGIALAGRAHFFNSAAERKMAMGLGDGPVELTLNEFNEEQIQRYLKANGLTGHVPGWMPSRPLLVGYLVATGLLSQVLDTQGQSKAPEPDPAEGWDRILDRVCNRESEIEAGIDGPTIRRILERLATVVRTSQSGLGPLNTDQIVEAFKAICGYVPDERALILLQRLPGLGIERPDEGTRVFLDTDWVNACMAGDVTAFIEQPYNFDVHVFKGAQYGLGPLGIAVSSIKTQKLAITSGKMNAALQKGQELEESMMLLFDLVNVALEMGSSIDQSIQIRDIVTPELVVSPDMGDCSTLHYRNCYFMRLAVNPDVDGPALPRFESCYFDEVDGRASPNDLPVDVFDDQCTFGKFTLAPDTVNAITEMDIPLGTRVLLTLLKKLYVQSGSGRKENALHRGLDHHGRRMVTPVLHMLQVEGLAIPYKRAGLSMTIWVPNRAQAARVRRIIASPHTCGDRLITQAGALF